MPNPSEANQDEPPQPRPARTATAVRVRVVVRSDAEQLAEINLLSWQRSYAGIVPDSYLEGLDLDMLRERWVARIEAPGERINLLAEVDGRIAAYAIAGDYRTQHDAAPEDTTGWGELYAIYAHPDLQRRGAGRAVHDAALAALAARGREIVALWVLRDNMSTLRWYGALGWRADGASSEWLGAGVPLQEIRLIRARMGVSPAARLDSGAERNRGVA